MKTLKLAFTILLCMVFVNSFSQTVFYQAAIRNGSSANTTFQKFNKNITIFLCPKPLENDADELKNFLKENWTLTPIRLVPFDSIDAFIGKPEYNLFMCKASCIYMGTMPLNYNFNFCLSVFNGKTDKGEWDYQDISRMILAPVDTFLNECTKKKTKLMKKYNAAYDMYGDGAFYNFSLANVELFIKSINYYFTNNKAIGTNSTELDKLKTSKLFVPYYEWMDINMNAMNGRQKHDLSKDNKAFKNYKYQYEKLIMTNYFI